MIVPFFIGAPCVLGGLLTYTGRWRSWTSTYVYRPYPFFGLLYAGLFLWFVGPMITLDEDGHQTLGLLFGVPAFGCGFLTILSAFWLPRRLTPAWFHRWQDEGSWRGQYPHYLGRARRRRG